MSRERHINCCDCGCAVTARGGRTVRCRECQGVRKAAINRQWRERNKERHAAINRQWYANNKERHAEVDRKWRENNPDYERNRRHNNNDQRLAHEMAAAELELRLMLG